MTRVMRGAIVGAAAVVAFAGVGATSASASTTSPFGCLANGTVVAQPNPDGTATWTVDGAGVCEGDFNGSYTVSLHGSGTSVGLSQCTGSLVTQDLELAVQVEVSNWEQSKLFEQTWSSPVDNYSVRTPFVIGGASTGAGYIGHNIFLACPGSGTPSASFAFSFL